MKTISLLASILLSTQAFSQSATFYSVGPGNVNGVSPDGKVAAGTYFTTAFFWTEGTGQVLLGEGEAFAATNDTTIIGRFRDPNTVTPNGDPTLVAGFWKNGTWTSIGGLPGVDPFDSELYSHGYGVSSDGSTIVGMGWMPNYRVEAFYWTEATGIVPLGQDGGFNSRANAANADGSVIAGWDGESGGPDRRAYYWDPAPHFMGGFDATYPVGESRAISPNGRYIVGESVGQPFIWTEAGGLKRFLDDHVYPDGGSGLSITDAGVMIGGVRETLTDSWAFYKTLEGEVTPLREYLIDQFGVEGLERWSFKWANGISADGLTIGGWGYLKTDVPSFGDAFVVRLTPPVSDVAMQISIDETLLPVPADGDTIPFVLGVTNNSAESVSMPFAIHLSLPDGMSRMVREESEFLLGPNEVTERSRDMRINAEGPPGMYEVVVRWGAYLENASSFPFEKTGSMMAQTRKEMPAKPVLGQNSPNPFNPATTISFTLPQQGHVSLEVYSVIGQRVAQLVDGVKPAGQHQVVFEAGDLASGIYLYRLQTAGSVETKKLILMK